MSTAGAHLQERSLIKTTSANALLNPALRCSSVLRNEGKKANGLLCNSHCDYRMQVEECGLLDGRLVVVELKKEGLELSP